MLDAVYLGVIIPQEPKLFETFSEDSLITLNSDIHIGDQSNLKNGKKGEFPKSFEKFRLLWNYYPNIYRLNGFFFSSPNNVKGL